MKEEKSKNKQYAVYNKDAQQFYTIPCSSLKDLAKDFNEFVDGSTDSLDVNDLVVYELVETNHKVKNVGFSIQA